MAEQEFDVQSGATEPPGPDVAQPTRARPHLPELSQEPEPELSPEPEAGPEPEVNEAVFSAPESERENVPRSGPETDSEVSPPSETRVEPAEQVERAHMTRRLTTRLGQLLIDADLLSKSQLDAALETQRETGERLGAVLVNKGFIDEPALLSVLESQYGVPAATLEDVELDANLARLIPADMARRYLLVPLALHADSVDVAMVDPTDFVAMGYVRFATGLRPNIFITTVTAAQRAIERVYAAEDAIDCGEPLDRREAVRRMISDRDALLMAADQDPRKFYELAASVDAFVDEIFRKVSDSG